MGKMGNDIPALHHASTSLGRHGKTKISLLPIGLALFRLILYTSIYYYSVRLT